MLELAKHVRKLGALVAGVITFVLLSTSVTLAQQFEIIHAFTGHEDSAHPGVGLVRVGRVLYGVASGDIFTGPGAIFKINRQGKFRVLYDFQGGMDGADPSSGLVADKAGNLYGTTSAGGQFDFGTVFRLDAHGVKNVLYSFAGGTGDGAFPGGDLLFRNGKLYGTTFSGGSDGCSAQGCGILFSLTTKGEESVLYRFAGMSDGQNPNGGLVQDSNGYLYGTTSYGGGICTGYAAGCGTVFKFNEKIGKLKTIYRFQGQPDGSNPEASVVLDTDGNLYGTTFFGGAFNLGTVFKLDISRQETILYSFCLPGDHCPDGTNPHSRLILDSSGNLYGTAAYGGTWGFCMFGCGTVFKLDQLGTETVLHSFVGESDGGRPYAGVTMDDAGNLLGTTNDGGPSDLGTVFRIKP